MTEGSILLLTRIWPTAGRPSLGSYVRDRAKGLKHLRVIRPRHMAMPWPLLYSALFIDALQSRGPIRGIEAHMVVPTGLVGWAVARLRHVPLVIYAHGGDVRDWERKALPVRWLTRFTAQRAERVVTNSEDTAAHIRRMGVEPIVAPPGVDLERFVVAPLPTIQRVLYLGGRNPRKGYDIAVKLADTLVGPWLRDVSPADIPALMAEHSVVLMPSVAEPFGLVAVEALASGRWVVASAVGGLRDIIVDGVNGTLVHDGDFARALATIPDYSPQVIAATAQRYSLERWQAALAAVWEDVIGRTYTPTHPA